MVNWGQFVGLVLENLKSKIKTLPSLPGVYRMINSKMEVIYIGKAKNIKKRVASYFVKKQSSPRTRLMIGNINSIEFAQEQDKREAGLV